MKDVLTSQLQEQLRISFERNLVTAVAYGQRPDSSAGFGPHTISAIEAIAREHPEAPVRLIAEAHDAFFLEHVSASAALGRSRSMAAMREGARPAPGDPRRSDAGNADGVRAAGRDRPEDASQVAAQPHSARYDHRGRRMPNPPQ